MDIFPANRFSRLIQLTLVLISTTKAVFGGEDIQVAVCNLCRIPWPVIERAEGEAAHVFQPVNVKIHWIECTSVTSKAPAARPDFILRLLPGGQLAKGGVVSTEAMGRALIDQSGNGYMLDAYYGAIQQLSLLYPLASDGQVLGYTIAHELGHLLIGPGHRSDGIMRASWGRNEVEAISHRFFYFKPTDKAAILRKLQTRLSAKAVNP